MGYSGAGGKLIHEKNQKQKISWHCPFKRPNFRLDGNTKIISQYCEDHVKTVLYDVHTTKSKTQVILFSKSTGAF
jgi:hypothetical protein